MVLINKIIILFSVVEKKNISYVENGKLADKKEKINGSNKRQQNLRYLLFSSSLFYTKWKVVDMIFDEKNFNF